MHQITPPNPLYLGPARHHGDEHNKPIHRIVIHATVSPCRRGQARATAEYFRRVERPASAHYVVDPFETVQVVYDGTVAYHAPPNEHSIGIELCDPQAGPTSRWLGFGHRRMLRRAARLTARLALAYDVPVDHIGPAALKAGHEGICGHVDVSNTWHETSHTDPGVGFPWDRFLHLVRHYAGELTDQARERPSESPAPA